MSSGGRCPKPSSCSSPASTLKRAELIGFCRERMAHFKAPKSVEFIEVLPKTATGKIQKFALREPYWQGQEKRVRG